MFFEFFLSLMKVSHHFLYRIW